MEAYIFFSFFSSVFIVILQQETCFLARTMLPWFLTSACHVTSTKVVNMKLHPGYEHLFLNSLQYLAFSIREENVG